jgi:hypothetical protein
LARFLRAISHRAVRRERSAFRITRDPAKLVRTATFDVEVLNSVRPPALEITNIVPAFQWDRSLDFTSSKRSGGWLRVYLGSKWFATGEGEALAVVGDPLAGDPVAAADPLHATASPAQPATITPKVTPVTIASQKIYSFAAHHDDELGLWYADLAFDVTGLYFPFVRLRLARFQQQSLPGLQLSSIVEAGFYQLAPDRAVALNFIDVVAGQPEKRKIEITVSGPRAAAGALTTGAHLGYSVEVGIEERALGAPGDQRDPHLGWNPSTTIVPSIVAGPPAAGALWQGSVIVPAVPDMDRRIVIKEFEIFPPDDPPPGQAWSGEPRQAVRAGGSSTRTRLPCTEHGMIGVVRQTEIRSYISERLSWRCPDVPSRCSHSCCQRQRCPCLQRMYTRIQPSAFRKARRSNCSRRLGSIPSRRRWRPEPTLSGPARKPAAGATWRSG